MDPADPTLGIPHLLERKAFLGALAGRVLVARLPGEAQQTGKAARIGILAVGGTSSGMTFPGDRDRAYSVPISGTLRRIPAHEVIQAIAQADSLIPPAREIADQVGRGRAAGVRPRGFTFE